MNPYPCAPIRRLAPLCSATLFGLACAEAGPPEDPAERAVEVRDSAGVQIVDNVGADIDLQATEVLRIGVVDGDAVYQFDRVTAIEPDGVGGVWVTQSEAPFRRYDASGVFLEDLSAIGEGPGEYVFMRGVFRSAEHLATFGNPLRIDIRSEAGELLRTFPVLRDSTTQAVLSPVGGLHDHWILNSTDWRSSSRYPVGVQHRVDLDLYLLSVEEDGAAHVLTIPGDTRRTNSERSTGEGSFFSGSPSVSVSLGAGIFVSDTTAHRVTVFDERGEVVRSIRREIERVPLDPADLGGLAEAYRRNYPYGSPDEEQVEHFVQAHSSEPLPDYRPVIDRLHVSDTGTLWVRRLDVNPNLLDQIFWHSSGEWRYTWTREGLGRNRYDVFDPEGSYRGSVTLPPGFISHAVTDDHIYGVLRDDFDVEYVVGFEISNESGDATQR